MKAAKSMLNASTAGTALVLQGCGYCTRRCVIHQLRSYSNSVIAAEHDYLPRPLLQCLSRLLHSSNFPIPSPAKQALVASESLAGSRKPRAGRALRRLRHRD